MSFGCSHSNLHMAHKWFITSAFSIGLSCEYYGLVETRDTSFICLVTQTDLKDTKVKSDMGRLNVHREPRPNQLELRQSMPVPVSYVAYECDRLNGMRQNFGRLLFIANVTHL